MTLGNNDKRTSAQQLMWVWNKIIGFFKGLFSHIRRCRGVYSFLSGALSTLLFLWAFIWYGVLAYPVPWKVIDPTDPRFDPLAFRFSDYDGQALGTVMSCLFPVGTPKIHIDPVLVVAGGASVAKYNYPHKDYAHPNEYKYSYRVTRNAVFSAFFNPEGDSITSEATIFIKYDSDDHLEKPGFLSECKPIPQP